jgi:hypothetical protein
VPEHNCPKNHEGSSKAMEPLAAIELLKSIFYNSNSYVTIMVMDDDSLTVANCKHSYKKMIEAGLMTAKEWPTTERGTKKKDVGFLPLEIPALQALTPIASSCIGATGRSSLETNLQ